MGSVSFQPRYCGYAALVSLNGMQFVNQSELFIFKVILGQLLMKIMCLGIQVTKCKLDFWQLDFFNLRKTEMGYGVSNEIQSLSFLCHCFKSISGQQ